MNKGNTRFRRSRNPFATERVMVERMERMRDSVSWVVVEWWAVGRRRWEGNMDVRE